MIVVPGPGTSRSIWLEVEVVASSRTVGSTVLMTAPPRAPVEAISRVLPSTTTVLPDAMPAPEPENLTMPVFGVPDPMSSVLPDAIEMPPENDSV